MADEDGGDWFAGGDDDAPPVVEEKKEKKEKKAEEPAPAEAAPTESAPQAEDQRPEAAVEGEYLDPDKFILFKHWIRPKFLQYNYLYKYRRNYYDDVIDYLDKRQRGLSCDVPRAQTWAERVLRSCTNKNYRDEYFKKVAEDIKLVSNMHISGSFFRYHSKQYVNRRYSSILY